MENISTSLVFFALLMIFIIGAGKETPECVMTQYKRQWRELSDEHKEKISQSSSGKPKSTAHRQHISQSMKQYWQGVPHRPDEEHMSMDEYLGISKKKPTSGK